mgnify:CR=1 FL=1
MKIIHFEAIIPEYLVCYLINGDSRNLSDEEIEEVREFENSFLKEYKAKSLHYSLKDINESPFFTKTNSINNVDCNCYTFIVTLINNK